MLKDQKCTKTITTNFLVDISQLKKDSTNFVNELKEKGILVTDAKLFRPQENNYIRVSLGNEEENKKFIQVMKELVGV